MNAAPLMHIIHWEINAGFLASLLFPVVTRFFWPWHESWWGWNTILLELSIAGCLLPSCLFIDFHVTNEPLQWSSVIFLGTVILNVLWRTVMVWRTQRRGVLKERVPVAADDQPRP